MNPYFQAEQASDSAHLRDVDIVSDDEGDEFWSFVGSKHNQRWTWYVIERESGTILAYHNGRRTDESCKKLFEKLAPFSLGKIYTDNWQSYQKYIPKKQHIIGKKHTWKIERKNVNFRTHIKRLSRKTLCFSKNETSHGNVIGLYISPLKVAYSFFRFLSSLAVET